jgi:hypothetical protein
MWAWQNAEKVPEEAVRRPEAEYRMALPSPEVFSESETVK